MDPLKATEAVLALINTRPLGCRPDGLNRWADLDPELVELALDGRVPRAPSGDELIVVMDEVRRLRAALAAAVLMDSDAQTVQQFNDLAVIYGLTPRPEAADHQSHPAHDDGSLMTELVAALLPPLRQAMTEGALERIGICPDTACQTVFLDRSRGRIRRYCSARCATRARMAKHRQRSLSQNSSGSPACEQG